MRSTFTTALAVLALVAVACGGGGSTKTAGGATSTTAAATGSTSTGGGGGGGAGSSTTAALGTVSGPCSIGPQSPPKGTIPADNATALAFAPDGRLFWTERSGTVKVWQDGAAKTFATVNTVTTEPGGGYSERGLLGLAISPTFARDHFVYAFYSDADRSGQTVVRWTDCAGTGPDPTVIVHLPAGTDCCHKGGRLAFGPDGKLYVTLGEEHMSAAAQDTSDPRGKVLRYNPDGTMPSDNPFKGSPVWAFGFRNPFGIAFSATGQLAVTNNGPTGDSGSPATGYDTVFANVTRGGGYQWPNCYGYSHPLSGGSCGDGEFGPDWSSEASTVVPTGATFVDSSGPAAEAGHLVFCSYNSGMQILTPGSPHATVASGPAECQLDVKQGPDHALYYSDTGHIYRLGA